MRDMLHRHSKDSSLLLIFGAFLVCFMMLSQSIKASASTIEIRNERNYENCVVFDEFNVLKNRLIHMFSCAEQKESESLVSLTRFVFSYVPERRQAHMMFTTGGYILDDEVDVFIRVDNGPLIKRKWNSFEHNTINYAISDDQALFFSLLDEMARGSIIVININYDQGSILLNRSTSAAISKFKRRIRRYR